MCGTSFTARRRFANFLAHFIGEGVHNAAQLGGDGTRQLSSLLARGKRPELVFIEYPNHSLFSPSILRFAGEIYGALDYAPTTPVLSGGRLQLFPRYREKPIMSPGFTMPVMTKAEGIAHSGDGVLAWRVRGKSFGAGVTLRTGQRPALIEVPWPRDREEVLVPIVDPGATATIRPLLLKSNVGQKLKRGRARIDSVELVLLADREDPIRLELGASGVENGIWHQELATPERAIVPHHGVLTFNLQLTEEQFPGVTVEIRGTDPRAPEVTYQVLELPVDSRHFINLSAFAGQTLESIRVFGRRGEAPGQLTRARILSAR